MVCPICGSEFEKTGHYQKFCSKDCQKISRNERLMKIKLERQRQIATEEIVRMDLVEKMKAKYANINIDEEIDRWLGV